MLQNECMIEERFREIKRQHYTIKLTEEDQRELNRYQAYYNANKLAYMMKQDNQALHTLEEEEKLRDNFAKPPQLSNIKEQGTLDFVKERHHRFNKVGEVELEYLTRSEVKQKAEQLELNKNFSIKEGKFGKVLTGELPVESLKSNNQTEELITETDGMMSMMDKE